jgi:hypothetical protein
MSPWSHCLLKGIALFHISVRTANFNVDYEYSVFSLYYKDMTMMHNIVSSTVCIHNIYTNVAMSI